MAKTCYSKFFSKAGALIFDELSSALDAVSESQIYENILKYSKDKIVFLLTSIVCIRQD